MTRASTIARAQELSGKPGLVCIGRFYIDGEPVDFSYSEDDLARDSKFWMSVLSGYGVAAGDRVVVTSRAWEVPYFQAVRDAVKRIGAVFSNSEFWGWDARRLELFMRRLEPRLVVGPGPSIEGLAGFDNWGERVAGVGTLLVRPEAIETLAEGGVSKAGVVTSVGPATVLTLPDGRLGYDENEWLFEDVDGELVISTVGARAAVFDRQRTGVRGSVTRTASGAAISLDEDC